MTRTSFAKTTAAAVFRIALNRIQARYFNSSRAALARALVVAEHNNRTLQGSTLPTITAAGKLATEVTVLVAGSPQGAPEVAKNAARVKGVTKVVVAKNAAFEHPLAETLSQLVVDLQKASSFDYILAPSTAFGKNFLPRAAALLNVSPLSDIISVKAPDAFVRPMYAGNVLGTFKMKDALKLLTVRTTAFEKAATADSGAPIEEYSGAMSEPDKVRWVSSDIKKSERPELTSARVVISGGRGMKSAENFKLLEALADKFPNAAVGASRAAVDSGYAPNDMQIGQTGKVVAPELYIAVGISGQIQHLAGMKDSKLIVAINKDPEAPIFQVADIGLVADLFKAVPELTEALAKLKK